MQPRLTRSTTERVFAGVCGGLGTYFALDPVIIRIIFVLMTLTSGAGIPAYLILLVLMPREKRLPAPDAASTPVAVPPAMDAGQHHTDATLPHNAPAAHPQVGSEQHFVRRHMQASAEHAATGPTVRLPADASGQQPKPRRNWRTLGIILLSIGALVLLEQLHVLPYQFVFPILLIVAGVVLLLRGRSGG